MGRREGRRGQFALAYWGQWALMLLKGTVVPTGHTALGWGRGTGENSSEDLAGPPCLCDPPPEQMVTQKSMREVFNESNHKATWKMNQSIPTYNSLND